MLKAVNEALVAMLTLVLTVVGSIAIVLFGVWAVVALAKVVF